jgi:hypothetical protein
VSDIAPPFAGFIELSQIPETTRDALLGKMLSGEHPTFVYSSEAEGKFEPIQITPAQFFKAWRSAQREAAYDENDRVDANGWPLRRMDPFQIRVPDQDFRRSSAVRRRNGVPHWIYLLKADQLPKFDPAVDHNEVRRRTASKEEIRDEIRAVYAEPGKPPNIKELPKAVQPRLHKLGLEASENHISEIGQEPQFDGLRRRPGKTIASEQLK